MAKPSEVIVHIDGASRGNPGPAAYGVLMESADGARLAGFSESVGVATNNFAEYQGLLAALEYALGHDYRRLRVLTDSELMALQIEGVYRVKNLGLKPLHRRALDMVARLESFSIRHVRREENREADRLANQALDEAKRGGQSRRSAAPEAAPALRRRREAGAGPSPASNVAPGVEVGSTLRASATFHEGLLEPHGQLPLFEGEVVDLEINRKR